MWLAFAFLSAFFAGITAILCKAGIRKTPSDVATAIRTIVVLAFSWLMVLISVEKSAFFALSTKSLVFLILSGIATGASWLCYFRALQMGDVNKVVPIDKLSTCLTIILAAIFLQEGISFPKALCVILIGAGTYMMIGKKSVNKLSEKSGLSWLLYAILSAFFASLTAILGKIGVSEIDSTLGTAIRTVVVLIMAFLVVFIKGEHKAFFIIPRSELLFIIASGFATGASWLCYYKALKDGDAGIVVPIDKLSIIVSTIFAYFVFKEKLAKKALLGLALITLATLALSIYC